MKGIRGTDNGAHNDDQSVCVSYWVNLLQNLPPGTEDLFVTLNPPVLPAPETVQHKAWQCNSSLWLSVEPVVDRA